MCGPRRPQRRLHFERLDHRAVVKHINSRIQSAKPGLMRKQLRQRDFFFASLSELRPKLRHPPADLNFVLLQHMEDTRAGNSLGGRPDEDKRITLPGPFVAGVAKATEKIDNWFSVVPNRNRRAQLPNLFEVLPKDRLQSLTKSFRIELHLGSCRAF